MKKIEAEYALAGGLALFGALNLGMSRMSYDTRDQECQRITITTPSGEDVTQCSNYDAYVQDSVGDVFTVVGFSSVGGAGALAIKRRLSKSSI